MVFGKKRILLLILFFASTSVLFPQEIFDAVKRGDLNRINTILEGNKEILSEKDVYGRTPLHWAVRAENDENAFIITQLLIEGGADVNAKDNNSVAAIHSAALRGYLKTIEFLITKGAEINEKDNTGNSPLSYAVSANQQEIIEILKSHGLKIPVKGSEAETLLFTAAGSGNKDFFKFMVDQGADLVIEDDKGNSLLFSASVSGNRDIISILLEKDLDINAVNMYGISPLFLAALNGNIETVDFLIRRRAEISITNPAGHTPLFYAELNDHREIINMLEKRGLEKLPEYIPGKKGEYLGLKKPGNIHEIFAYGIISADFDDHGYISFSPDGREIYWTIIRMLPGAFRGTILYTGMENGRWTVPCSPSFADKRYDDWYVTPSYDGKKIFFSSRRPVTKGGDPLNPMGGMHIWYVEKEKEDWSDPVLLDTNVSTGDDFALSISENGNLYFSSMREGGLGSLDIYYSKYVDGKFSEPENLDVINSEYYEDGPFIARDESYIIFESSRPGGIEESIDLYISFKKGGGNWTVPKNMGDKINSLHTDRWGRVSPDGKYLFFGRWKNGGADIYWIDAEIIDELKPDELK